MSRTSFTVCLPEELADRLASEVSSGRLTRNGIIRKALEGYLGSEAAPAALAPPREPLWAEILRAILKHGPLAFKSLEAALPAYAPKEIALELGRMQLHAEGGWEGWIRQNKARRYELHSPNWAPSHLPISALAEARLEALDRGEKWDPIAWAEANLKKSNA